MDLNPPREKIAILAEIKDTNDSKKRLIETVSL